MDTTRQTARVQRATCEAIFNAIRAAAPQTLWVRQLPQDLLSLVDLPTPSLERGRVVDHVRWEWLLYNFLRKWEGRIDGLNPEDSARARFSQAEHICRESNYRLRFADTVSAVNQVFWIAGKIIGDRCANSPALRALTWGPGVTDSVKGQFLGLNNKLTGGFSSTRVAWLRFSDRLLEAYPEWAASNMSRTASLPEDLERDHPPGNYVTFVPKNAKTLRSIAIEPHINAALQRCVGSHFRNILRKWGCDLNNGQQLHRELARKASRDGEYATIDLSMASDTISRGVVSRLMPSHVVDLLDSLRSPCYHDGTRWKTYYKHSSMGNGYTFELETMIFYGLANAVQSFLSDDRPCYVYGDDIIIPRTSVPLLLKVLSYAGFSTNVEKSFWAEDCGFRESCGGDFYEGVDVSPVRCRTVAVRDLETLHNRLLNWSGGDDRMQPVLDLIVSMMPRKWPYVPIGLPGGIWSGNNILHRTRFSSERQERQYLGWMFEPASRRPDDTPCHLERTLLDLPTRRLPYPLNPTARPELLEFSHRVNNARGRGRWVRRWLSYRGPYGW